MTESPRKSRRISLTSCGDSCSHSRQLRAFLSASDAMKGAELLGGVSGPEDMTEVGGATTVAFVRCPCVHGPKAPTSAGFARESHGADQEADGDECCAEVAEVRDRHGVGCSWGLTHVR